MSGAVKNQQVSEQRFTRRNKVKPQLTTSFLHNGTGIIVIEVISTCSKPTAKHTRSHRIVAISFVSIPTIADTLNKPEGYVRRDSTPRVK